MCVHRTHSPTVRRRTPETHDLFVAPLDRLLRDGASDGTLDHVDDPTETAAVLFNVIGWGYVHLRHAQHWPSERARPAVVAFATATLRPRQRTEQADAPNHRTHPNRPMRPSRATRYDIV